MAVQLSFSLRRSHNENVVCVPPLLPDVVSLSERPDSAHFERSVSSWLFMVVSSCLVVVSCRVRVVGSGSFS
ncbi:MAG: hypothetical protein ACT4NY_05235 [Pseudonocardiales bacterium]